MSWIDLPEFSLQLAIQKWINNFFSILKNIQVKNRKSDLDILQNKLMVAMRPWTSLVWNSISSTWQTSNWIFFTWVDWNRYQYVWHWNKVYKNIAGTWTDIWATFTNNNFNFNVIKLPYWNPTSIFTTSAIATWSNKVKVDPIDTNPAQNVWKYLMIVWTDAPTVSTYAPSSTDVLIAWVDTFRNKYSIIKAYDAVNNEYYLTTLWNAQFICNWTKYQIFDKLDDYLQITNWVDDDQYYDWTALNTTFKWRINQHFWRFISWFKPQKIINFDWLNFTYKTSILYRTEALNNLWANKDDISEMPFNDLVNEIFVWKNRLIVWWLRSVSYTSRETINDKIIYNFTILSDNYWMVKWWVNNFEKDVYLLTNNKQMISLAENQYWIVIPTNVWATIDNYLKTFNYNIVTWFDWRKFYIYWEETAWVTWIICVYDTQYNFWSTYTWLSPSKFILEWFDFYMLNNKKWEVYKFVEWLETDNLVAIEQELWTIDLDWNNIFIFKESHEVLFHFENLSQEFNIDTIRIWQKWQSKYTNSWSITEQTVQDLSLWESILWEQILWWNSIIEWLPLPYILKKELWWDAALSYIFTIKWKDWSPFYLNDMIFKYSLLQDYFNPEFVI